VNETIYLYALHCPVRESFYYVGKSVNPIARYEAHLSEAKATAMHFRFPHLYEIDRRVNWDPKKDWTRWLIKQRRFPELVILEQGDKGDGDWKAREYVWINHLMDSGHPLTNCQGVARRHSENGRDQEMLEQAIQKGKELFPDG